MNSSRGPEKTDEHREGPTDEFLAVPFDVDTPLSGSKTPLEVPLTRMAPPGLIPGTTDAVLAARGYTKGRLLGSGGCAKVYEATSPGGLPVAIKIIFLSATAGPVESGQSMDLGTRELEALSLFKEQDIRHAYLIQMHAFWIEEGNLYIVMERADGSLKDCRGLARADLLRIFREAAEAVDLLHERHILHRDIKPANILLVGGHAKVADMGLARPITQDVAQTVQQAGTLLYMAPEITTGETYPESDQYSFAMSYAELRLGRPIIRDRVQQSFPGARTEASYDLTGLLEHEEAAVRRALSTHPKYRFPSCSAFVEGLETPPAPPPQPMRGKWWLVLSGVLALIPIVVLAWYMLSRPKQTEEPTPPPKVDWQPDDMVPDLDARIVPTVDGKRYYDRLLKKKDGIEVLFLLIPRTEDDDEATFYIMENKVRNGLFKAAFRNADFQASLAQYQAKYKHSELNWNDWQKGARRPKPVAGEFEDLGITEDEFPVLRINFFEADCFAQWLGGQLPSKRQFEKVSLPKNVCLADPANPNPWHGFAVNRLKDGPMKVGTAVRDVHPVHRVRDTAGNGREWMRTLSSGTEFKRTMGMQDLRDVRAFFQGSAFGDAKPFPVANEEFPQMDLFFGPLPMFSFRVVLMP